VTTATDFEYQPNAVVYEGSNFEEPGAVDPHVEIYTRTAG